jgi:cation transporter-like permease
MLTSLILPGHLIFFFTISFVDSFDYKGNAHSSVSIVLIVLYLFFATLQVKSLYLCLLLNVLMISKFSIYYNQKVLILLTMCYFLVHSMWKLKNNPDNFCIPLLTSLGDFLGVVFLFVCFHLVYKINSIV